MVFGPIGGFAAPSGLPDLGGLGGLFGGGSCDPSAQLWPASFKGAAFYVLSDEEAGGRRLVIHEFPGRDRPFVEDLGAKALRYEVTAYLASESAASAAAGLSAACKRRGAGTLVLPTHGPLQVCAIDFKRSRERDRLGYIAYSLSYVEEGAASALASAASLANLIFAGADAIGGVIGGAFAGALGAVGLGSAFAGGFGGGGGFGGFGGYEPAPDYIRASGVEAFRTGIAAVEVARSENAVEPSASARQRAALKVLHEDAPDLIDADPATGAARYLAAARAIGDGMRPSVAVSAFRGVADTLPNATVPATASVNRQREVAAANAGYRLARVAALVVYAEGLARVEFASRVEGVTARADVVEYLNAELGQMTGPDDAPLYEAVEGLRNTTVAYLSTVITTLAPVVTVETKRRLPALVLAYRLYREPARSRELIDRNAARVPSRMPLTLEALAA